MSLNAFFSNVCQTAFYQLYNLTQIRKYLSAKTVVHGFVTTHIDYCNALLYGLPKYQIAIVNCNLSSNSTEYNP